MWFWKCCRQLLYFTQKKQKNWFLCYLFIFIFLINYWLSNAFLFDNAGCLSSCCCCGTERCPFGINNFCCPLGNLGCGSCGLPLLNLQFSTGSLSPPLPLPTQPAFQPLPPSALGSLFCAPPCSCGACAPPLLLAPSEPLSPPVAPIIPIPRILQPPQPQSFVQSMSLPVTQPLPSQPAPRSIQFFNYLFYI